MKARHDENAINVIVLDIGVPKKKGRYGWRFF
jgi:hypothetical protein